MKKERRKSSNASRRKKGSLSLCLIYGFVFSFVLFAFSGIALFLYYSEHLPDYRPLKARSVNASSIVYSEEDQVAGKFLLENRIPISYARTPKLLIHAFVAAEDAEFFQHKGVDYKGIARALFKNLIAGRIVQGGSTITQQVTKTFFLTPKRSFLRKLKEMAYAFGLEHNMSKEEILSLYLNNIYLGNGAYGIEAAAESYFNKRIEQLNLAETAMMAGLAKAPSRYSPINNFSRAKGRQIYVLGRMVDLGFISQSQKDWAFRTPIRLQSRESAYFSKAPYFTEFIRHHVEEKYGKEKLYQEGLRIYTTLNLSLQRTAERAVEAGLRDLDKRQGFRGPIRTISTQEFKALASRKASHSLFAPDETHEATVLSKDEVKKAYIVWVEDCKGILPYADMIWALHVKPSANYKPGKIREPSELLKPGDVIQVRTKDTAKKDQPPVFSLEQEPVVQGALLCIDPRTGYVKAMVGGRDFSESQFNRATNSKRQPGSAFKPFIYAAAIERGYTPSTVLLDSPVEFSDYDGGTYWAPKNYDRNYMGPITFRNALAYSRNIVAVKILEDIGIGYGLQFFERLGIESPIRRNLSVALGTSEVSMMEMSSAFGVFANGGERIKPVFIRKIATMKGEVLEENDPYIDLEDHEEKEEGGEHSEGVLPPLKERVLSPQQAFLMTHLLEGVIQHGTGQAALQLGRPVAGKTGTSSDYADAWFVGYSSSLLATVWVGFDDKSSLGKNETGARAALPIWIQFMQTALQEAPAEPFQIPEGITLVKVDLETGLPPAGDSRQTILEAFVDGHVPAAVEKAISRKAGTPLMEGPGRILPEQKVNGP